jgi:hypothetical protein
MSMNDCAAFAFCIALMGCGSEDDQGGNQTRAFHSDQTCGLRVELGGDLVASFTGGDTEFACVHPIGPAGIHTTFVPIQGDLGHFQLDAGGVEKGAIGTEFAAKVRLIARDQMRAWETEDCTVDIASHEFVRPGEIGEQYRATGSGRCAAASSVRGGEPVVIRPFDFVVTISWLGTQ